MANMANRTNRTNPTSKEPDAFGWTPPKSLALSWILVKVVLALLVAALFCIPICTEWYDAVSEQPPIAWILNLCLYASDGVGACAILSLDRLLSNIKKQEIFTAGNVTCLRIISWSCFGVAAIFGVLAFWRSLAWMVAFAAAFFGLILRVLKNVFALAVELRQEHDYTI